MSFGNYYGTSKMTLRQPGKAVVLDIDLEGVKKLKSDPTVDAHYIFIKPPNSSELATQLRDRNSERPKDIEKRLTQAQIELCYAEENPQFHDKIIINDKLEAAYEEFDKHVTEISAI